MPTAVAGTLVALALLSVAVRADAGHECLLTVDGSDGPRHHVVTQSAHAGVCRFDLGACSDAWTTTCAERSPAWVSIAAAPSPEGVTSPVMLSQELHCRALGFLVVPSRRHRTVRRTVRVNARDDAGHRDHDRVVLRCRPEVSPPPPPGSCIATGCAQTTCTSEPAADTCEWNVTDACYRSTTVCEMQADGGCGWTPSAELDACLADPQGPRAAVAALVERAQHEIDAAATPPEDAVDVWGAVVDQLYEALAQLGVPWRDAWHEQVLHDVFPNDLDVGSARRGFVNGLTRLIDGLTDAQAGA
jgi:hypothetical protein